MNMNPLNLAKQAWAKAHESASQAAINSRAMRIVLVCVNIGSMVMLAITLGQTFRFIDAGKVNAVVGTLLGGVFVLFGTILGVGIPALVTALKGGNGGPTLPPPTVITPPPGDNA